MKQYLYLYLYYIQGNICRRRNTQVYSKHLKASEILFSNTLNCVAGIIFEKKMPETSVPKNSWNLKVFILRKKLFAFDQWRYIHYKLTLRMFSAVYIFLLQKNLAKLQLWNKLSEAVQVCTRLNAKTPQQPMTNTCNISPMVVTPSESIWFRHA